MSDSDDYRDITIREREVMEANGCSCDDWGRVRVATGFIASSFGNVSFSGDIMLGIMDGSQTGSTGITEREGIWNARLHNCKIGNHVVIRNIQGYIANYTIEDNVTITDCGTIYSEGESCFGNGIGVNVLNEAGGRKVRIWDELSSQIGYIAALWRHRGKTIRAIDKMIDRHCESVRSSTGYVGSNSNISGCRTIHNVRIGPGANIDNSLRLSEGSVNSDPEKQVCIGPGVIMERFIVSKGSVVTDQAVVKDCYIGEGCYLGMQFTAVHSLFFANCSFYHGEACSVFAGPFTVSHHKSTLLIAGMFSFMNAGSGTNQSNHMYKLGPIHQGILERGSKTGSDSYLLWPARIGPFTLVVGRHYGNPDTSSLPFSYLVEKNGGSLLIPAINLTSVGTIRDARKWPKRDKRNHKHPADLISFDLLSPYTVMKMIRGRNLLDDLAKEKSEDKEYHNMSGFRIARRTLKKCNGIYSSGIDKYLGGSLIRRIAEGKFRTVGELRTRLTPTSMTGVGEWVDIGGMVAPLEEVEAVCERIENMKMLTSRNIRGEFEALMANSNEAEWNWTAARLEEEYGKPVTEFTPGDVTGIVERWKKSVVDLDYNLYEDALKEFSLSATTGFGTDGGREIKRADFEAVRGNPESNPEVQSILEHIKEKTKVADRLITQLKNLKP
jgi:carbonic anhydrase/acetyltransferase-like protein (isoleucine patch superfamily)